jgi:GAF domain-containing protein
MVSLRHDDRAGRCGAELTAPASRPTLSRSGVLRASQVNDRPSSAHPHRSTAPGRSLPITGSQHPSAATAELQQLLLATDDITEFLHQLAQLTVTALKGDIWCGITTRRNRHPVTVASSDARASQVDEVQYQAGQGPCLTSLDTGTVVHVTDLVDDDRWGEYRTRALGHGVRSSLSLPLHTAGAVVGALNIYAGHPRAFSEEDQRHAEQFAAEASRTLALALRLAERTEMSAQLQDALASRAVIDQALGVIMAQRRCTADDAFETLRTISQNTNTKAQDVAASIIAAISGQQPPSTPRFSQGPGPKRARN